MYFKESLNISQSLSLIAGAVILFTIPVFAEPSAKQIIERMDESLRGNTSHSRLTIEIRRPRYERTIQLDIWEDSGADKSFIRILRPARDEGITFLKDGNNLYQYIPSVGREIRIEGSMLQDSWMGSDFSNDDLVNATSMVEDYDHRFIQAPSNDVYRIKMTPVPSAAIVWSKVIIDIRKSDNLPVRQEFYDHRDRKTRIMEFSNIQNMGGRSIPTRYTMTTLENDQPVSQTVMIFNRATFNQSIPASIFSRANLRR